MKARTGYTMVFKKFGNFLDALREKKLRHKNGRKNINFKQENEMRYVSGALYSF